MISDALNQIVSIVVSAVCTGVIGYLTATVKAEKKKTEAEKERARALEDGVQALLKNKLLEIYDENKDAEEVSADTQEVMDNIYKAYHALGGNGTGTRLHDAIMRKKATI